MFTTTKRRLSFIFVSLLFATGWAATSRGQAAQPAAPSLLKLSVADEELLLRLSQQLTEAQKLFSDPQRQSQSIDFLGRIVSGVEDRRRAGGDVPSEILDLERKARELRARVYFDAGQLQGAADDFRQLLLDNPRYKLEA